MKTYNVSQGNSYNLDTFEMSVLIIKFVHQRQHYIQYSHISDDFECLAIMFPCRSSWIIDEN